MKNIYVMFSHTGTNFSKVLKIYTGREYTHVSISMDKEMKKLYSFGRTSTKENPMSARFVKEDIYRGVYKELAYRARCCIYEIEVTEEQFLKVKQIVEGMKSKPNTNYNFLGILFIPLRIPVRFGNKFVCSQFVAHVLENSGVIKFDKNVNLVTPEDILSSINGEKIYEGFIRDYKSIDSSKEMYEIRSNV